MAYPASSKTLAVWLAEIDQKASLLKSASEQQKTFAASSQLNTDMVRRYYDLLKAVHSFFTQAAAVTGIGQYAKDEKGDQGLNPVTEFQAMQAAIVTVRTWIQGQTANLVFVWPDDDTTPSSAATFTAAQTATYRTQLDALIATIG